MKFRCFAIFLAIAAARVQAVTEARFCWGDTLPGLKENLSDLSEFKKDILIIETGYPHEKMDTTSATIWPMTPQGQRHYFDDLAAAVTAAPHNRGVGIVWWCPEAVPLKNHAVWNNGAMGLFDLHGDWLNTIYGLRRN